MNQSYVNAVRLLLNVAPTVFQNHRFAMKGGTALNLFVQDMPRLSVDIDLVFTDHTLDRAISSDLKAARSALLKMGHRVVIPTTASGDDVKFLIAGIDASVKIEVILSSEEQCCR